MRHVPFKVQNCTKCGRRCGDALCWECAGASSPQAYRHQKAALPTNSGATMSQAVASVVIFFQGQEYRRLFPDLMRDLTPEEYADLGEAIKREGEVVKPIIDDGNNGVIDGWNRLEWAVKLGFEKKQVPFDHRRGVNADRQEALARAMNDTGRQDPYAIRQQNRAKRIGRVVEAAANGVPTREIAEQEGVSQTQVMLDLATAETDESEQSEQVDCSSSTHEETPTKPKRKRRSSGGGNGVPKPCRRCKIVGAPACPKCQKNFPKGFPKAEEPAGETWQDRMKRRNAELEAWCVKFLAVAGELPADPWLNDLNRRGTIAQKVKDAVGTARSVKCSHQCPECKGAGCQKCHKTGTMPKAVYDQCV